MVKPIIKTAGYIPNGYARPSAIYNTIPFDVSFAKDYTMPTIISKAAEPWNKTDIPPVDYGVDICTVANKSVKVFDCYVDNLPLNDVTLEMFYAGDGTKNNPFRSITYALVVLRCWWRNLVSGMCDMYFIVHVKGTLNYTDLDIIAKYPQLENIIKYENVRFTDESIIFDFDGCSVDYIYPGGTGRTYYAWDGSLNSVICMNLQGRITAKYGIECTTQLQQCDITFNGVGGLVWLYTVIDSNINIPQCRTVQIEELIKSAITSSDDTNSGVDMRCRYAYESNINTDTSVDIGVAYGCVFSFSNAKSIDVGSMLNCQTYISSECDFSAGNILNSTIQSPSPLYISREINNTEIIADGQSEAVVLRSNTVFANSNIQTTQNISIDNYNNLVRKICDCRAGVYIKNVACYASINCIGSNEDAIIEFVGFYGNGDTVVDKCTVKFAYSLPQSYRAFIARGCYLCTIIDSRLDNVCVDGTNSSYEPVCSDIDFNE